MLMPYFNGIVLATTDAFLAQIFTVDFFYNSVQLNTFSSKATYKIHCIQDLHFISMLFLLNILVFKLMLRNAQALKNYHRIIKFRKLPYKLTEELRCLQRYNIHKVYTFTHELGSRPTFLGGDFSSNEQNMNEDNHP